jgi:3-oxoadipate enol-lactonase
MATGVGSKPTMQGLERKTGWVDSEGERIYFEQTGTGSPVVLCHGLGGNHAIWWRQIEALAARHTVVTWDQRGFGNSSCSGEFGPAAARRDLQVLLEALGLDGVHLIGQSMGGWVVLGFALGHQQRVRSLVLSTTLAGADPAHVRTLVEAEPQRLRNDRRSHPVLTEQFCREEPDLAVLYNQISSLGQRIPPGEMLRLMGDDMFSARVLETLHPPTFVLCANEDTVCPPAPMAEVARLIPGAELRGLPGGHSLYYEQPDRWNAAVLDFLERNE